MVCRGYLYGYDPSRANFYAHLLTCRDCYRHGPRTFWHYDGTKLVYWTVYATGRFSIICRVQCGKNKDSDSDQTLVTVFYHDASWLNVGYFRASN